MIEDSSPNKPVNNTPKTQIEKYRPKGSTGFVEGNPGRPKGALNKRTIITEKVLDLVLEKIESNDAEWFREFFDSHDGKQLVIKEILKGTFGKEIKQIVQTIKIGKQDGSSGIPDDKRTIINRLQDALSKDD